MMPGRLRSTSDVSGRHDYRAAYVAVATMANVASILGPKGGPSPLHGVEPDEIEVALEARSGVKVAVGDVDGDGRGFMIMLTRVLDAPVVTDAELVELAAKSDALVASLDALRDATESRFAGPK